MSLLIAMLPIYLMGNFHCIGMCGPIAMLLGNSPFWGFYLLGRLVSFTLAGLIAGAFGEVLAIAFKTFNISGLFSILMGLLMCVSSAFVYFNVSFLKPPYKSYLDRWLFSQDPWPLFLVGFFTIALPCGQTLLVFSACALSGNGATGTLNGFVFGLLTTPSLYLAMRGSKFLLRIKHFYRPIVGGFSLCIGMIAILRGFAEMELIPHFGIHPVIIY